MIKQKIKRVKAWKEAQRYADTFKFEVSYNECAPGLYQVYVNGELVTKHDAHSDVDVEVFTLTDANIAAAFHVAHLRQDIRREKRAEILAA